MQDRIDFRVRVLKVLWGASPPPQPELSAPSWMFCGSWCGRWRCAMTFPACCYFFPLHPPKPAPEMPVMVWSCVSKLSNSFKGCQCQLQMLERIQWHLIIVINVICADNNIHWLQINDIIWNDNSFTLGNTSTLTQTCTHTHTYT